MNVSARPATDRLAGPKHLDLRGRGLETFPAEIYEAADTLEVLDLSGNALQALPEDLGRLHRLRVLFCSDNRFEQLPASIGQCTQLDIVGFRANRIRGVPAEALPASLRWLILTDNRIDELPPAIGRCTRLQKLMLAGNHLARLPPEMAACRGLELLRIAANRLEALPEWLTALPRLAWLAFAGNPFDDAREAAALSAQAIPAIGWRSLVLQQVLGEGASGVIHQAGWQQADGSLRPVAVKLFKGAVTSDGWPHSEMTACLAAGAHPNLIAVLGRIEGHPEGGAGLVLELVDPAYRNLAGPPSLQSCTRDVYAADAQWPARAALSIARGLASATAQLHARGVLHGDLYAHNILWNARDHAFLGDFGAASFLPDHQAQAQALQRIEARAFGCLLEELAAHVHTGADATDEDAAARALLDRLRARCLRPEVASRPAFDEIAAVLDAGAGR